MESSRQYKFGKARKIKRKKEISGLLKSENRLNYEGLSVYYSENRINRNRLAIIVPKATGNAVVRNKIKRYVRAYFRNFFQNITPHIDILVKTHPAKDVKNFKYGLEKAFASWLETVKK